VSDRFIQRTGIIQQCATNDAYAQVELLPLAGCSGCERQRKAGFGPGHCGIDLFGLRNKTNRVLIPVSLSPCQTRSLKLGDSVDVRIPAPNGQWLAIAFQVYGFPVLGLIAGAALGSVIHEFASVTFSLLGCWAGLHIGRRLAHVSQSIATLSENSLAATRIVSVNE